MFSGGFEYVGGTKEDADYIYYNADIVNQRASDQTSGFVVPNPQIRFNETRDSTIIRDASKYNFSIVRFTMNGPGLDLPLFIPDIQENQSDINKTSYGVGYTYTQQWNTSQGVQTFNLNSDLFFVTYSPEILNTILAPLPASPVGATQDISTQYYWVRTYSHWLGLVNQTLQTAWASNAASMYGKFAAEWIARGLAATDDFPFPTQQSFIEYIAPPRINYDPTSRLFTIEADASAFGEYVNPSPGGGAFVPTPVSPSAPWNIATAYALDAEVVYGGLAYKSLVAGNVGNQPDISPAQWLQVNFTPGALTQAQADLYFNSNMYNLFANFEALYYNTPSVPPYTLPAGFVWKIVFTNKNWENLIDYTQAPYNQYVPLADQKRWWQNTQDYICHQRFWSARGTY